MALTHNGCQVFGFRGNKYGTYTASAEGITVSWTNTSHYHCHDWEDTRKLKPDISSMATAEEQVLTWGQLGGPPCGSSGPLPPPSAAVYEARLYDGIAAGHVQVIVYV